MTQAHAVLVPKCVGVIAAVMHHLEHLRRLERRPERIDEPRSARLKHVDDEDLAGVGSQLEQAQPTMP